MRSSLRPTTARPTSETAAFTLVELMAVIVIIALLSAMILALSDFAGRRAMEARAKGDIETIGYALVENKMKYGIYPATQDDLTNSSSTAREWLAVGFTFIDPWERAYEYARPQKQSFTLFSHGHILTNESGVLVTADDIRLGGG